MAPEFMAVANSRQVLDQIAAQLFADIEVQ
jgi:hypothetical protein